jgi:hypothetical protein
MGAIPQQIVPKDQNHLTIFGSLAFFAAPQSLPSVPLFCSLSRRIQMASTEELAPAHSNGSRIPTDKSNDSGNSKRSKKESKSLDKDVLVYDIGKIKTRKMSKRELEARVGKDFSEFKMPKKNKGKVNVELQDNEHTIQVFVASVHIDALVRLQRLFFKGRFDTMYVTGVM